MEKLFRKKSTYILLLLLFWGFIYRLILLGFVQQFLIYDMDYYRIIAEKMMEGEIVADILGKTFGYPAFLAALFTIFGKGNFLAVKMVQILLDLGVAMMIFSVACTHFGRRAGWISFILALFCPITAVFTGLILPETLTMFLICLLLFILTRIQFGEKSIWWIGFGGVLGYLLFTRFQFYYFVFFLILMLGFLCIKKGKRIGFIAITILCVLLTSSYTLFANYRLFHTISLGPLKSMTWTFLYFNYFGIQYPELLSEIDFSPNFYGNVMTEFLQTAYEKKYDELDRLNAGYKASFLSEFPNKWPTFVKNVFKNFLLLWDKRILAPYTDPFHPNDVWILRIGNLVLVSMFATGIIRFVSTLGKNAFHSPLFLFTMSLLSYMAVLFSLVSNESRHTISFYPLIYLWGGLGIVYWIKKLRVGH